MLSGELLPEGCQNLDSARIRVLTPFTRAEADVRRGDGFEDIQDSWPEERISVEALAVEPYPELE
jgi:hypothetical protein